MATDGMRSQPSATRRFELVGKHVLSAQDLAADHAQHKVGKGTTRLLDGDGHTLLADARPLWSL